MRKLIADRLKGIRYSLGIVFKMDHVFVYGSLKRNEPNHYWLDDKNSGYSQYISDGVTVEKYPLVIASRYNIPFLLDVPGEGHNVSGEVYEVDYPMLQHLDILERHPDFYVRELRDVLCEGEKISAWVYLLQSFRPHLLEEPFLEDYSSNGDHGKPFVKREERDPTHNVQNEVQN